MARSIALIIEDNTFLGEIFAETLETAGFETEIVWDGAMAFQRVVELKPALVILDLHLPHVSGVDILYQIRAHEGLKSIRVAVVTADVHRAEHLKDKADLVLVKPIGISQLLEFSKQLTDLPADD
jgi:two-component system cell cycle response regulator DivK